MKAGRKWRRTAIERYGKLVPLPDNWSLIHEASGLAIAQIIRQPDGMWKFIIREIRDSELKDGQMGWEPTGQQAKEYCERQTDWRNYTVGRKRTKEEILAHAGVRPKPRVL